MTRIFQQPSPGRRIQHILVHNLVIKTGATFGIRQLAPFIFVFLTGCLDPGGLNQFSGQHISWPPPSFSLPAAVGVDRYEMTYPYVTDPNYLRLTKALATDKAWRYCNGLGFKRAEVDDPEPERITFTCQKPGYRDPVNEVVDRNGPVVDEKKLFRNWGAGR